VFGCGNAAGNNGPVIFVLKGKNSSYLKDVTYSDKKMVEKYSLPPGSTVIVNSKAYMDNDTWVECVKKMLPGIRQMPVSIYDFFIKYVFIFI
jgi:hypothetical protein